MGAALLSLSRVRIVALFEALCSGLEVSQKALDRVSVPGCISPRGEVSDVARSSKMRRPAAVGLQRGLVDAYRQQDRSLFLFFFLQGGFYFLFDPGAFYR